MKLKIKRFDETLPLPEYKTDKAAALDLYARVDVAISPGKIGYVPLNIALELPENYWALLAARSSLHKRGLMMANGIGVGDEDYCGDNDEYRAVLFNFTDQEVTVKKGERIVQLIILSREKVEVEGVIELNNNDRGGFGSTGI
ncbi:MAG: dUTP diphosphatase [Candidatus Pacebacteria bacterium]|jgi:dUTP pyrophosphatase|nr:dUTP diphosphatase [Candidatus Paceibacterota bacterium]MBT3512015.1 dUTP diphosphatase [Candidatus Paceibacterota bacterium]MBT4004867.1 dUTP diphosphatase [Candidatus Paceibacterota bacterium]MBT4359046.1 dUTP diphosphatase [Candidatus Paceibacterota bacterium]MBT4680533.1 dUTP diphosphatase [Candidatus Paceibacterota bacterium]